MEFFSCRKKRQSCRLDFSKPAPVAQLDRAPGYEPGGLEVRTLSGAMIIQAFPSGPLETNAYVIACEATKKAAIIDPAPGSFDSISAYIKHNQLIPQLVLLTHSHWDHTADASKCKKAFNIPLWVHAADAKNVETPGSDELPCWMIIEGVKVEHFVEENERFNVGDLDIKVIFTPGHTPGCVCYYIQQANTLFSGDTLFKGSIGRLDLPTGRPELMWESLEKLAQLPKETVVYSGHGSRTTIGKEKWLANAKEIFG